MAPPPPSIRRRRTGVIAIILTTAALVGLMAGVSYFALMRYSGTSAPIYAGKNGNITNHPPVSPVTATSVPTADPTPVPTSVPAQVMPTPTVMPTATPVPTAAPPQSIDAQSVYSNIVNHLDSNHSITLIGSDNNWNGWTYAPEHGALIWTDATPDGVYTVEVAVFSSPQEAQADYQCQYDNACSKQSYQGNPLQGSFSGKCLYMDNNYNGSGSQYSSYMLDELLSFNNVQGC